MTKLLIVNADDFGLTQGVSRAILRGHRHGILTSTSVLTIGAAYDTTIKWLADEPGLGAGVHLAAVGEDPPLLSAREIPSLVDRRGRFHLSWRQFLPRLAAGRIDIADVEREFEAQLERFRSSGLRPTHLDTHQHLHLWPAIGRVVVALAVRHAVPAVRVTRSMGRSPAAVGVRRLSRRLEGAAAPAGLCFTGASAGFDEGGTLALPALLECIDRLERLPEESAELAVHPGEHGDPDLHRFAWGYRWGDELDALVAPEARASVDRAGFRLGTFADLGLSTEG